MSEARRLGQAGPHASVAAARPGVAGAAGRAADALQTLGPALLFGLRLWASVCLALFVTFWLELDNGYWAGTSAAIVCQPNLGASLRKGWFRMVGTLIGAVAIVELTALFPQDRGPFLVGLALWGGACAFVATILKNFSAYAAALAGYTAAIIANDQLGATGGPNGDAFMLAINRVSEIGIGIVCAGIVLAGTDFGGGTRRLAVQFAALAANIANLFTRTLSNAGAGYVETQSVRREFTRRAIALDPVIDEAFGESSSLRYNSAVLKSAADGLFEALSGWRGVAALLLRLPESQARQDSAAVLRRLPQDLQSVSVSGPAAWMDEPVRLRQYFEAAASSLIAMAAGTPSLRLLADQTARTLTGIWKTLNGIALLKGDPDFRTPPPGIRRFYVPDWLPALVNGTRAFAVIGSMAILWIVTEWPSGALAMTFAAIAVILFAPRADQAYAIVMGFIAGTTIAAILAAIVAFAVLPGLETFPAFAIAIGAVLVPSGTLMALQWQPAVFLALTANFCPLLAPANVESYDTVQFYNSAMAIVVGTSIAALSYRVLPPLSAALRTRRLLALTLRSLGRLATGPIPRASDSWEIRTTVRLAALPDEATALQRAHMVAALSVGCELIKLRRIAPELDRVSELDAALAALARQERANALAHLARLDRTLASGSGGPLSLQARSHILAITEALTQHAEFFGAGDSR